MRVTLNRLSILLGLTHLYSFLVLIFLLHELLVFFGGFILLVTHNILDFECARSFSRDIFLQKFTLLSAEQLLSSFTLLRRLRCFYWQENNDKTEQKIDDNIQPRKNNTLLIGVCMKNLLFKFIFIVHFDDFHTNFSKSFWKNPLWNYSTYLHFDTLEVENTHLRKTVNDKETIVLFCCNRVPQKPGTKCCLAIYCTLTTMEGRKSESDQG